MQKVVMITAVPKKIAEDLSRKRRVVGYNTLPNVNARVLQSIREFMTEHVGYSDLPMACLSKPRTSIAQSSSAGVALSNYLPINSNDCIMFQLEMPDDLLVSVGYQELLMASSEVERAGSEDEIDFLCEEFKEQLKLGVLAEEDQISFIPFLDYERCKFYALLNPNFGTEDVKLPGLAKIDVREMTSFLV